MWESSRSWSRSRRASHIAIYEVNPKCDYGADESEVAERMSERADTAEKAEVPRGGAFGRHRTNRGIFSDAPPLQLRCGRNCAIQNSRCYATSVTLQRELELRTTTSFLPRTSASTVQQSNKRTTTQKCDYGADEIALERTITSQGERAGQETRREDL